MTRKRAQNIIFDMNMVSTEGLQEIHHVFKAEQFRNSGKKESLSFLFWTTVVRMYLIQERGIEVS